jgi:hypothetical protein
VLFRESGAGDHFRVDGSVVTITNYRAFAHKLVNAWASKAAQTISNMEDTPPEPLQQKTVWGIHVERKSSREGETDMYVYMNTCLCIYIYTHTHTHTHTHTLNGHGPLAALVCICLRCVSLQCCGIAPDHSQTCIRPASVYMGVEIGVLLVLYWCCIGVALVLHWCCAGLHESMDCVILYWFALVCIEEPLHLPRFLNIMGNP